MSFDLSKRVWWIDGLSSTETLVFLCLTDHAHNDGSSCYPSVERIANRTGFARPTVQRTLRSLEKYGWIKTLQRKDRTSLYEIQEHKLPTEDPLNYTENMLPRTAAEQSAMMASQKLIEEPGLFGDDPLGSKGHHSEAPGTRGASYDSQGASEGSGGASYDSQGASEGSGGASYDSQGASEDCPNQEKKQSKKQKRTHTGVSSDVQLRDVDDTELANFIASNWESLKADYPHIADIKVVNKRILDQCRRVARDHMGVGETSIDVWRLAFNNIRKSPFLLGMVAPSQGRSARFKLSIDRMTQNHLFERTINGKYLASDTDSLDHRTGNAVGPARAAASSTVDRIRQAGKSRREHESC